MKTDIIIPILNHSKLSITEKRRNKTQYLTWNSKRFKFVKKTSMQNLSKAFHISSATAQVATDLLKALAILSDILWEDPQLIEKT